jgi:hypothetical protein
MIVDLGEAVADTIMAAGKEDTEVMAKQHNCPAAQRG